MSCKSTFTVKVINPDEEYFVGLLGHRLEPDVIPEIPGELAVAVVTNNIDAEPDSILEVSITRTVTGPAHLVQTALSARCHSITVTGTYWVGDPCYVMSDRTYERMLYVRDVLGELYGSYMSPVEFEGGLIVTTGCDGDFFDQHHTKISFSVDSGMLSVLPLGLVTDIPKAAALGKFVDLDGETVSAYSGQLRVGDEYLINL